MNFVRYLSHIDIKFGSRSVSYELPVIRVMAFHRLASIQFNMSIYRLLSTLCCQFFLNFPFSIAPSVFSEVYILSMFLLSCVFMTGYGLFQWKQNACICNVLENPVPYVGSVSGFSIFDCPFGILWGLYTGHVAIGMCFCDRLWTFLSGSTMTLSVLLLENQLSRGVGEGVCHKQHVAKSCNTVRFCP